MPETSTSGQHSLSCLDPADHLPLSILRSDIIPPAPTPSQSTIDWLPDLAGYAWIAYGASSLLVISHLPSPLSSNEFLIGSFLRQVFELSGDHSSAVTAVSWSPVTPSIGELAAASDNCIYLFSHDSASSKGSFVWSQNAVLLQSTKVEAIKWTGSGDGVIAGGIDVVLWRRKNKAWEIAWKFKRDEPQTLLSATWSIKGPSASAACLTKLDIKGSSNASKCVLVTYCDGASEYEKYELQHPQPVSMIQWRPSTGRQSHADVKYPTRHMLLTCCFDGTARLWTEVDDGKVKKFAKDNNDRKEKRRSFSVVAVIEINQPLKGSLGVDVFLNWATESRGIYTTQDGTKQFLSTEIFGCNKVGKCEWLIGFGPGTTITFWAIHCLDDVSPMRFPRVTLWRRLELQDLEGEHIDENAFSEFKNSLHLNKVVISRNCSSGPPDICSLVQLLPCNSFIWSLLRMEQSGAIETTSSNDSKIYQHFSGSVGDALYGGHTGKILQVAVHPCIYELGLAASLDSNGLLLLWSISNVSNHNFGLSTLVPMWKLCGKFVDNDSFSKYTSLKWAPSMFDEDHILLMGHAKGIDCFVIKVPQIGGDILCHLICTIPLTSYGFYEDGPPNIFVIPLPSACKKTFKYNKFMLLGVWMEHFQALSWEVTLHSCNILETSCECNFDGQNGPSLSTWKFENVFADKRYFIGVDPCSSQLPEPYSGDQIISFSVVGPGALIPMHESHGGNEDICYSFPPYIMATGCSDGSIKLWRSKSSKLSTAHIMWELVGKLVVHQGPVNALCLTDCGRKIATISSGSDGTSKLHIWDSVHLIGVGSFVLEETISIDRAVVALNWLALGNGQLLLGICTQNSLQIYAQKHSGSQTSPRSGKSLTHQTWSCLAVGHTSPDIQYFLWGPQATAVFVHENYVSLLSQWLFLVDNKEQRDKDILSSIFTDFEPGISDLKEPSVLRKINGKSDCQSSSIFVAKFQHDSYNMLGYWSLVEVAEKLKGTVPVYHPEALLMNIFSGNWKRAYISVRHLVQYLTSGSYSEKRYSSGKNSHVAPQIPLSNYFEGVLLKDSIDNGFQWGADVTFAASSSQFLEYDTKHGASSDIFTSSTTISELHGFVAPLKNMHDLAAVTNAQKLQILAIIDLLTEIQKSDSAYENLDEPGRRFWVALRYQQLNFCRSSGRSSSVEDLVIDTSLMCWAFHSDCQETLLSSFLPNESSWKEMQILGIGFWFTNVAQLRTRVEKLARMQFLKNRDPKDCALLYIALNRLQVLAGLFKISKDEKDKPLMGFLSRNFQEEKNKAAALKNAYVLMGRHQLELAIAFFLLGGDNHSAITVCAKNLGDEQLALVICRLVEGRGGPLERHLITKLLLPSATQRDDYWLASLLEWELGNYSQSFLCMFGCQTSSLIEKSALSSNQAAFLDPNIGIYCLKLATNNCMRNAIGEQNAAILGRWATYMAATAFNRSGLPLEALECLSSSLVIFGSSTDQGSISDVNHSLLGILKPSAHDSQTWLSGDVALHLESSAKLDLALQYFSKLTAEHPSWPDANLGSVHTSTDFKDSEICQYDELLESFQDKLYTGLLKFEQKFSVVSSSIIKMILVWLCNNGLLFTGYDVLLDYTSHEHLEDDSQSSGNLVLCPLLHKPLLKAIEDISHFLSRFIVACSMITLQPNSCHIGNKMSVENLQQDAWGLYFQGIMRTLCSLKTAIRICAGFLSEDLTTRFIVILDLYEFCVHFASAWLQQNSKALLFMVQQLFSNHTDWRTPCEIDMAYLKNICNQITELLAGKISVDDAGVGQKVTEALSNNLEKETLNLFSGDEKWHVMGACLWQHIARLMKHKLDLLPINVDHSSFSRVSDGKVSSPGSSSINSRNDNTITEQIAPSWLILASLLKNTLVHVSSYHIKIFGSFLQLKVENRLHIPVLAWLQESNPQAKVKYQSASANVISSKDELSIFDKLWDIYADPNIITEGFAEEKINWLQFINRRSRRDWSELYESIRGEYKTKEFLDHEVRPSNNQPTGELGSSAKSLIKNGRTFLTSWQKDATFTNEVFHFQNAKEIYKRDGELLEALCVNSINEGQAAIASNRKGIIYFSWDDGVPFADQTEYIWSNADWPPNGWAGTESTPVPTCVSPGVGLGSKQGAHLGLGEATLGTGSLARPRKDLPGGGAFGIPGYAGVDASRLGWEVREDFEEFIDPPAIVENISTRAFSSHPSRPFFLVGSSNTHVYLWEFGKDNASATYGVLPAANVPPPYALASISALQFDYCGHRFVTAALDGTVCTWQLEVGGRSNIRPTESSLCFNGHASDVAYVTSSGSVVAASGHSSNGVNVVVWDTLAPPTTSRASIVCHEGGARSISAFDNDIGSGSVSPLIVTGGKGGDVGLHDFRYIATGRTKRNRHFDNADGTNKMGSNKETQTGVGDQNQNGMLWYIPKAHLGSITKVCTIPHTSLFLTGSKDGDVKLWDAKATKLVYHWPKLHERHTFLQPSTRGFGGVVRAAVTDIQVVSHGFLTCGGDGSVKLIQLRDYQHEK